MKELCRNKRVHYPPQNDLKAEIQPNLVSDSAFIRQNPPVRDDPAAHRLQGSASLRKALGIQQITDAR